MRTLIGMTAPVLLGLVVLRGADRVPCNPEWALSAPNEERAVTLSKSGVVLASVTVPKGTSMVVSYDPAKGLLPTGDGRFEFFGDVEIRAQAVSQRNQTM